MGMEIAMMAVSAASAVGEGVSQVDAEHAALTGLNTEGKEQTISYQQKTLANYDSLQKLTDAQTAEASVRGFSLGSASFNAIQRASVNKAAKEQQNLNLTEDIVQNNITTEKKNVADSLFAQLFGDVVGVAKGAGGIAGSMPTGGA